MGRFLVGKMSSAKCLILMVTVFLVILFRDISCEVTRCNKKAGCKITSYWPIWMFPKWGYPQIIHFNRVFHYKPSILGYPYFWKPPYAKNSIETFQVEDPFLSKAKLDMTKIKFTQAFPKHNIKLYSFYMKVVN